ncbi:MaoC/PaaZ C-terminal domain-containing protein [Streptosporangium roseum]|uniref:Dehydratase n=1 Tax=Streptosporangium roseum (strain ATCC 12428 / DSM 43021 / JCM 3005 / KCTC 9067 / NCIMB 10171 / NRRL 2505 / NI 9100) TaxID=479432 RepID=D2B3Q5_STRRD|nr:MaoC/PaaZ C-terminal domain-containing protein [Streptosporangium roseum]ACZ89340.1 dehydratase [Streptosporangium roseum DSM 43021]
MRAGQEVPALERTIGAADMIAYAGATWDWHRLHHDAAYLRARGLDRPVVDGQLFGALLAEQVQDWLGPDARLRRLRFRLLSMVFAGESVRVTGVVTGVEGTLVTVEQKVLVAGRVAVGGTAQAVLP